MSAPNRLQSPLTWWSPLYGLVWSDDDERTYLRVEEGQVVKSFTRPAGAVALYEGPPCCCGEC